MPEFQNLKYNKPKMQPPVVSAHDCSLFLCSFKQSKAVLRLKEDMKKVVARPGRGQPAVPGKRLFGVHLQELHREGLVVNGVPCLVWNIVEYLRTEGLTQEGLFRVNGNVKVVEQLRHKYEHGEQVILADDGDVHSAASLLKMFLREMPDGIISSKNIPRIIQGYHDCGSEGYGENGLKELIKDLPDTHYSLLKYLCHFLTQVVAHHAQNRMNIYNLATVFGPSYFHVSPGLDYMKQQETCNRILERMLEDYEKFFHCEPTERDRPCEDIAGIITVREYNPEQPYCPGQCVEVEVEESKQTPREKAAIQGTLKRQLSNTEFDFLNLPSPRIKEVAQESSPRQLNDAELAIMKSPSPRRKEAAQDCSPRQLHNVEHEVLKLTFQRAKEIFRESPGRKLNNAEFHGIKLSSSPRIKETEQDSTSEQLHNAEYHKSPRRKEAAQESLKRQLNKAEFDDLKSSSPRRKGSSPRHLNHEELDFKCTSPLQRTEDAVQRNPMKKLNDAEFHCLKSSSPRRKETVQESPALNNAKMCCITSLAPSEKVTPEWSGTLE